MNKKELIVFGAKGTAAEISEIARHDPASEYEDVHVVSFFGNLCDSPGLEEKLKRTDICYDYIIGFVDYETRGKLIAIISKSDHFSPTNIVHSSAVVAPSAKIGRGCYVGANATVSTNAVIGDYVIVNLNATVGHNAILEDHVIILPGARISGNVNIGYGSIVGSNAFIYQGVRVGELNVIDALTPIHKDLEARMISSSRNTKSYKRVQ